MLLEDGREAVVLANTSMTEVNPINEVLSGVFKAEDTPTRTLPDSVVVVEAKFISSEVDARLGI
jgi:hypothetical protein